MLKGATIFYSVNLMNHLFLNMCQWNLSNLFDCVNKKKRLEATKLLFQQILLLNSVKYNFSLWLKSTKKFFSIFLCFGITIFRLDRKNCIMKNEKWIIFPKSQYVNSNPEYVKKHLILQCCFLIAFLHYQISLSPCFVDNTTDKKTNEKFYFWSHFHTSVYMKLFAKEVTVSPTQYQQFEVPLSQKYGNITVQKSR